MVYVEKIKEELAKRLKDNNYEEISITMKCNGDVVTIKPMSQNGDITTLEDAEYFLVHSPSLPWLGGDTLDVVAKQIAEYTNTLAQNAIEKQQLREYFMTRIAGKDYNADDWGYYSDWYKDVYGRRPQPTRLSTK